MTTLTLDEEQIGHLAGLLAGVASADGDFDAFEAEEIGDILAEICPGGEVPVEAARVIAGFDYEAFSIDAACAALGLQTRDEREAVLALLMRVVHADTVADAAENAYLVAAAEALGAHFEEVDPEMVVEVATPPPLPPKS